MKEHNLTLNHVHSIRTARQWLKKKTIDVETDTTYQNKVQFWQDVLKRLVVIILSCARNHIALRRTNDTIGNFHNGNFLSQVEMLAQFDVTMNKLISKPARTVTYLSHDIQNELIDILYTNVVQNIIEEVLHEKYYSLILDTTQDVSKIDQLNLVLRYVQINQKKEPSNNIIESFLGCFSINDQTSSGFKDVVLDLLTSHNIDIHNCRGQGYDGASNMRGQYSGLQKRICDLQTNAFYVHCAAHNLNLVVNDSVKEVIDVTNFFGLIQSIYVFFGHSIARWDILSQMSRITVILSKMF